VNVKKIVNEIKNLVSDRDMTLTQLAQAIGKRLGKKYSLASLSQKLRNGTISYQEVRLIAEILNYKIIFYDLAKK
jgi:transcriptional regulator CtsR